MLKKAKILSIALLFPVLAAAYTPQKEALLVGVGEYQNGMGMMNLDGVDKDILRMKKLLEERGFHVRVLFNSEATLDNVRRALRSYQNLSSNDSFFYYESSHGTQVPDVNGDEEDKKDEAFVLYDAEFGSSGIMNSSGLLIDDELESMLSGIPAKKVMFADACHSGTMYKGLNSRLKSKTVRLSPYYRGKGILGPVRKPENLVTLSASGDREQSLASPQGSLFTSAVYDAWSSQPDITFQNMERLTAKHIENRCMQERSGGGDAPVFHPALYATKGQFKAEPIDQYLQVNITINQETNLAEDYLDSLMADGEVGSLAVKNKA
ncbi:MAG TPA: caspase family protein, partial [Epsilonproteobacteria bacterium]|nr:caspase family protein [Campylobacterota bacterium]